jgi:signal transduction histidine kinase
LVELTGPNPRMNTGSVPAKLCTGWSISGRRGKFRLPGEAVAWGQRYGRRVADDPVSIAVGAFRWVVPVLAGGAALAAILSDPGSPFESVVAVAAVLPFVIWALWPRRLYALALVPVVGIAELVAQKSGDLEPLMFLVCIAAAVIGISEPSRVVVVIAGFGAAAIPFVVAEAYDDGILYAVWVMGVVLPLLLAWGFRRQLELADQLSAARHALARQVVVDEKRRIARDVHDLVGHGLAAVLLHVTGARHIIRRDVDAADEALADAEAVGHRSLAELRRTLSLLRTPNDDGTTTASPVPDAGDIADAVRAAQRGGLAVDFTLEGDVRRIDPIVGLSLHRVVDEALNNAHRYAPRAATDVTLTVGEDVAALVVESIGPLDTDHDTAASAEADRPRYGIVGMRERMAAVGGQVEAGPTPTGWIVRCHAPLAPSVPATPATEAKQ